VSGTVIQEILVVSIDHIQPFAAPYGTAFATQSTLGINERRGEKIEYELPEHSLLNMLPIIALGPGLIRSV